MSKYNALTRACDTSHKKKMPKGMIPIDLFCVDSSLVANFLEHLTMQFIYNHAPENTLINLQSGGSGFHQNEDIKTFYVYCLYYADSEEARQMAKKSSGDFSRQAKMSTIQQHKLQLCHVGTALDIPQLASFNYETKYQLQAITGIMESTSE